MIEIGGFKRVVGVVIFGTAGLGALGLGWAVAFADPEGTGRPSTGLIFGAWEVLYDTEAPSVRVLIAAAGLALLVAAGVASIERRIANRARRSVDPDHQPLAPRVVMAETRGVFHGPVAVTVLIPAHNEESALRRTLTSLLEQSHRPERVIVVADNCTDRTAEVARAQGIEVYETIGNTHKKAGALNQVLALVLPGQGENDVVMAMDADTTLDPGFLENAVRRFTD